MKLEGVYAQMGVVTTICLIFVCDVVTGDQSHLVCSGMSFEFSSVVRSTHQKKMKRVKNIHAPPWGMHGVFTKMLEY